MSDAVLEVGGLSVEFDGFRALDGVVHTGETSAVDLATFSDLLTV